MADIPRSEYPRPQFRRDRWLCLNGEWQFEIDHGDSGLERGLLGRNLDDRIIVPFCPESLLSGIANEDFMEAVWYRRKVTIPKDWRGSCILLHFQAIDYEATVWIDGRYAGRHRGGFSPFHLDITEMAEPGRESVVTVRARDSKSDCQPRGKQTQRYGRYGCMYTRTTGIWQTVWMEPVPQVYLKRPRITPDVPGCRFRIEAPVSSSSPGYAVRAAVTGPDETHVVTESEVGSLTPVLDLVIPSGSMRLWSPDDPFLYDITLELLDSEGHVMDRIESYGGMRTISIDGPAVKINGNPLFQRLVLDQGYYPDGLMTAPDDVSLKADIELSLEAGFNGARLHQKIFEERLLYHADRLGYLVWGEFPDWGISNRHGIANIYSPGPTFVTQWLEALERDYSHPCIIGWCPLNECRQHMGDEINSLDDVMGGMFLACRGVDPTRPVLDASGYSHRIPESDIYDCHDYEQDPAVFAKHHERLSEGRPFMNGGDPDDWHSSPYSIAYAGQPFFVSEFGGIWWNPDAGEGEDSWGYGNRPATIEEFYERFDALCAVLLHNSRMFGYCYTQLTDVFQEQNGIYRFDRSKKFDMPRIRASQQRPAAIEG